MDIEISDTWRAASSRLTWVDYRQLLLQEVPSAALLDLDRHDNAVGVAEIAVADGKWRHKAGGNSAYVVPVWGPYGDLLDLLAFRLGNPRSYWPLLGHAALLGYESLEWADHYAEPLQVHPCPLEWLRAGRRGIVIIDWRHYWPLAFARVASILVEDVDFARRLRDNLQRPFTIPEIQVPA